MWINLSSANPALFGSTNRSVSNGAAAMKDGLTGCDLPLGRFEKTLPLFQRTKVVPAPRRHGTLAKKPQISAIFK
ncbi:hypothetical protein [Sphingomonas sp. KC8]|uniref:hypothetical protein n=1 Tax=Sphingomonas sp. KC8 TaxID=1030157 RepID=UPI0011103C56|nr:hypothetical protein [Sphingomonas sp. KC8]